MARDYYEILGVSKDATDDEIKKAYRKLARKYHPDVSKEANAVERFKEINEANSVLSDPEKRGKYDRFGHGAFRSGGDGGVVDIPWEELMRMFTGAAGGPGGGGGGGFRFDMPRGGGGSFADLFGGLGGGAAGFGGGPGMGGQRARPDMGTLEATFRVDPVTAVQGGRRSIALPAEGGGGSVDLNIPGGVYDGQKLRLKGKGRALPGGKRGDLLLILEVEGNPIFRRDGTDLEVEMPLFPSEALLGVKLKVPTPEGPQTLVVPAGVSSGQRLRRRGKGLAKSKDGERGDLYYKVRIVLPKNLTKEQIEQLSTMEAGVDPRADSWGDLGE